jgi:hypothetical protein
MYLELLLAEVLHERLTRKRFSLFESNKTVLGKIVIETVKKTMA